MNRLTLIAAFAASSALVACGVELQLPDPIAPPAGETMTDPIPPTDPVVDDTPPTTEDPVEPEDPVDPVEPVEPVTPPSTVPFSATSPVAGAVVWSEVDHLETCAAWAYDEYDLQACSSVAVYPLMTTELGALTVEDGVALIDSDLLRYQGNAFRYGVLMLYLDGNGNDALDLLAPGTPAAADTLLASSLPVAPDADALDWIVYKPAGDTPAWDAFNANLGCPEPPAGYSLIRLDYDYACTVVSLNEGALVWANSEGWLDDQVCQVSSLNYYGYPTAAPPPTSSICIDDFTLVWDAASSALCADHQRYDLVGCGDTGSQTACYNSAWDLSLSAPDWWPCGVVPEIEILDGTLATDSDDDIFMGLRYVAGPAHMALESLGARIQLPDETVHLQLELDDIDGDGGFSAGDTLWAREGGHDLLNESSLPGRYAITFFQIEWDGYESTLTTGQYEPVALMEPPEGTELSVVSGPTYTAVGETLLVLECVHCEGLELERLSIEVTDYSTYYNVTAASTLDHIAWATLGLLTHVDPDMDGLVSTGDQIEMVMPELADWMDPDSVSFIYGYVTVRYSQGYNHVTQLASHNFEATP